MSNRTYLYDVKDRGEAEKGEYLNNFHWLMKWCTPIFWYACFEPADEVIVKDTFIAFMTPVSILSERLSARKEGVIKLLPEALRRDYSDIYDRFSSRLTEEFQHNILLDMSDFLSMMDYDEESQEMVRAEINLFSDMFKNGADVTLDDFPVASAFIGDGVPPANLDRATPRELAKEWQYLASGESSKSPGFLHEPSIREIDYAEKILAEQKAEMRNMKPELENRPAQNIETPKETTTVSTKPWWKFWGD